MKRIAVYCGSRPGIRPEYAAAAAQLGVLLAREKIELVYGGGCIGLMGVLADAVLQRTAVLAGGLNVRVRLVAVHSVPYAVSFGCPAAVHAHLVEQLVDLASRCPFPVEPQVVMARGWVEGFEYAMHPDSTVLVGTRKHFWRTREESLARDLARGGHNVALIHVQ